MLDFSLIKKDFSFYPELKNLLNVKLLHKTTLPHEFEIDTEEGVTYGLYQRTTTEKEKYGIYCKTKDKLSYCNFPAVNMAHIFEIFKTIAVNKVAPEHLRDVLEDMLSY